MKVMYFLSTICLISILHLNILGVAQSVSFAKSLGEGDPYMHLYYQMLSHKRDEPNSFWFKYIAPHNPKKVLEKIEDLYLQSSMVEENTIRIPKIIHQIWIGPKPFPQQCKAWQKTWQDLGWEYHLWTDREVASFQMVNRTLYDQETNYAAKADILRIEILNQIGGLYVDVDFECIQPNSFDTLHRSYDFFCGITPLDCKSLVLNNAIIGSIPQHPILGAIIEELARLSEYIATTNMTWCDEILLKGPGLLTKMFIDHAGSGYRDIAFPSSYFYPFGVFQSKNQKLHEVYSCGDFFHTVKTNVKKQETLAIHWWDGSWTLEKQ